MSYYLSAWVLDGVVVCVETDSMRITENHIPELTCDYIVRAKVDADYIDAGAAMAQISLAGEGHLAGLTFVSQETVGGYRASIDDLRKSATLTRREFFLRLDAMGIYDAVMNAELPRAARIELDTATSFDRNWPTLVQIAHSMGFTDEQLDALFNIEVTP